jgi:hypothetical protein
MSAQQPPLTVSDVEAVLKKIEFQPRPRKSGSSHQDWVPRAGTYRGKFRKVQVDPPKAPSSKDLIRSMAHQAGLTMKEFYRLYWELKGR